MSVVFGVLSAVCLHVSEGERHQALIIMVKVKWRSGNDERFVCGDRDEHERINGACMGKRSDHHELRT